LNSTGYREGADLILISSASSKTAFCLAYCVQKRIARKGIPSSTKIVGLTSEGNIKFTQGLGLYHEVLTYDQLNPSSIPSGQKGIFIDLTGNPKLQVQILSDFKSTFVAAVNLGVTTLTPDADTEPLNDWSKGTAFGDAKPSTGPVRMEPFFMPEWLACRRQQFSISEITSVQMEAWSNLMRDCKDWVKIERVFGGEAVQAVYNGAVKGGLGPETGYILSLWNRETKL
jgi:hypothetical protein